MSFKIKINEPLSLDQVKEIYLKSDYGKPVEDVERLTKMIENTPLVISVWNQEEPIGFMRCLTDYEYYCYVSDFLFLPEYQGQGLGRQVMNTLFELLGERVTVSLRADDDAKGFYQTIGLAETNNMFRITREA